MLSRLGNRSVLITGASSGIGAATARAMGALGARLFLGARRVGLLGQTAAQSERAGSPQALFHVLDVATTASVEAFVQWVRSHTDTVDVLINNAGGAHGLDAIGSAQDADLEAMVQANLLGLLRVTRAVLPLVPRDLGAYIINVGSVAGHQAYEGGAAYCAVKAGELQVTRALRLELNGTGIRVGTIDPGLTETDFSLVRFKGDVERAKQVYQGTHPLTADDVAEAIVWMASRPSHVNVDEVILMPVDQAAVHKTYRRSEVS